MVNMKVLDKRLPSEISGDQQQSDELVRARVSEPFIMLLDDSPTNLDANLREEMRFEIKELQKIWFLDYLCNACSVRSHGAF